MQATGEHVVLQPQRTHKSDEPTTPRATLVCEHKATISLGVQASRCAVELEL